MEYSIIEQSDILNIVFSYACRDELLGYHLVNKRWDEVLTQQEEYLVAKMDHNKIVANGYLNIFTKHHKTIKLTKNIVFLASLSGSIEFIELAIKLCINDNKTIRSNIIYGACLSGNVNHLKACMLYFEYKLHDVSSYRIYYYAYKSATLHMINYINSVMKDDDYSSAKLKGLCSAKGYTNIEMFRLEMKACHHHTDRPTSADNVGTILIKAAKHDKLDYVDLLLSDLKHAKHALSSRYEMKALYVKLGKSASVETIKYMSNIYSRYHQKISYSQALKSAYAFDNQDMVQYIETVLTLKPIHKGIIALIQACKLNSVRKAKEAWPDIFKYKKEKYNHSVPLFLNICFKYLSYDVLQYFIDLKIPRMNYEHLLGLACKMSNCRLIKMMCACGASRCNNCSNHKKHIKDSISMNN
jgi:hypothetical protein